MSNFEFDKEMFLKEDEKKSILRYIPGYRSNKLIKKVIASIYYTLCILMLFIGRNLGEYLVPVVLIIGFTFVCHIIDLIFKKEKRNLKSIKKNIGLPFIAIIISAAIIGAISTPFNPQEEAAKELGITLEEYNTVIKEYNDVLIDNKSLEESNEASKLDYENKQKEYDNLVKEFDTYKESVPEESIKELNDLKTSNENYKKKISDLESKISELENKLN